MQHVQLRSHGRVSAGLHDVLVRLLDLRGGGAVLDVRRISLLEL